MKTNQILASCVVAFALNSVALVPSFASAPATVLQGDRTISEEASAIVTRIERSLGGLNNGQRDALRQGAESYARDSRTAQQTNNQALLAAATAQFDRVAQSALAPAQYDQYLAGKDFYLTGRGQRPASAQPANGSTTAATISNRFEQAFGGLNNGQRDAIRQGAETYVRDRTTAQQTNDQALLAAATAQFDNVVKAALSPEQFTTYQSNRDSYLNGRGGGRGNNGNGNGNGKLIKPGMRRGQR
ncbi:hypothetical protein LGH70_09400 [Hymenobacter sp. BT635]|uniref:Conjugal transfer protein TrbJ n=1 Tax=Hymenobacter nitidus TaxID=2880929 RepID=A0ABS8AD25_9BACT|nr:hypothetical protein [Hymenobacter nitidus]MCB2377796.1 hypothetical protein [Hymenobacter nitidus]